MSAPRFFGARVQSDGVYFSLWAQGRSRADVEIQGKGTFPLSPQGDGHFAATIDGVGTGTLYRFSIDGGKPMPDLASRWQPHGHDGPSMVMQTGFAWTDTAWSGVPRPDQILYELHIGTFTQQGTWRAAAERLPVLRDLGITLIQVMPVGTFKGRFGWGYDTTMPYAPFMPYGTPDDMKAFVDAAHGLGIGVILDVVYNHAGMGNHYMAFSERYFTKRYETEWGASFNYDGEGSRWVRDFVVGNAIYWVSEFHLDGLRIDAAQAMFDASREHIIAEIVRCVRAAASPRHLYIVVENQPQQHLMVDPPSQGGYGVDAMVNDDFQHSARVAITGHNDYYYRDYLGTPQELVSALKYGFLYQGQRSNMREKAYGTYNLDTAPEHFVHFLENHDQVANSARGFRLSGLASPARLRALTSLLLLGPQTPCLFQGQEFGATNPFLYLLGLDGEEAKSVAQGRNHALSHFPSVTDPALQPLLPDPSADDTFQVCKLDWCQDNKKSSMLALHRDLIALRKSHPAFSQMAERRIDGAVIGPSALLLRYLTPDPTNHMVLLVNFGRDLEIGVVAEPLMAPAKGQKWSLAWSSEHPSYDGAGRRPADMEQFWILPADCALLFGSTKA